MEIVVEGDARHPALPRKLQDIGIAGSVQARLAGMQGLPAFCAQQLRGPWGQALVEQDLPHATRFSGI
jgi:hypothetical protein